MTQPHPRGISVFFPVYKDERTVETVTRKSLRLLASTGEPHEVVIVDDGSPDRSGEIADALARENPSVRVIHHPRNLGYGAAVRTGLAACRYEFICMTDGDDEYEVDDFRKLLRLRDSYDLVITFRYKRIYSGRRILMSKVYNALLRFLFDTRFRDVSTGLRLVRKSVVDDLALEAESPFIGAEIAIKTMFKGYRVGEAGIQTFPRRFGKGSSTTFRNVLHTLKDVRRTYRKVFSDEYDLPAGRPREGRAAAAPPPVPADSGPAAPAGN
jgi:glycosyltransferase involved in cell wall biosynthesis